MTIYVDGVGMHPFGQFRDKSVIDLARVAILNALDDAGVGPRDIDAVYAANSMNGLLGGQEMIRGQVVLRELGMHTIPITNIENACASGSTAIHQAVLALRAGAAKRVLVIGFEKMFVDDRDASLAALQSASDLSVTHDLAIQFTAIYGLRLQLRLEAGEITLDDLADVAVKSHEAGARNPYAQFRKRVTREQVLNSRMIADPLTLLMCSSISDGAAAAVLSIDTPSPLDGRPRIRVRSSVLRSGDFLLEPKQKPTATLAAEIAYEEAGIGPTDIGVFEVHDAMAPAEMIYYEDLGLCAHGGAADFLRSGMSTIDGKLPVNPSGGLSSRGHPVGATGVAQIAELVWQLRGEAGERQVHDTQLALAQNSGGWLEGPPAACAVHILERSVA
jgi:acetyl-CoA acetyltransferase